MRVLLIEDDEILGKATADGLKGVYAVDWYLSAEDAIESLRSTNYDLMIFDINLPGRSGLDLLKELRMQKDNRPIIFLTARDTISQKIEGLNAGADDYLVKPFDLDELLARISALIRRSQGRAAPTIVCGDFTFDFVSRSVLKNGKTVHLSAREVSILEILLNNAGRVLSKAQIEEHIYGWSNYEIGSNTVEVHIASLRRKLGRELIQTIRGLGYIVPV